jgi:hypothetical protein
MCEYPMIALMIEITAIAFFAMVAAVTCLFRQAARAPEGYEDSDGFHLGVEPDDSGMALDGSRAMVQAVVVADDNPMPVSIHHGPPAQAAF